MEDTREAQRRFKTVTDQQTYDLLDAMGRPFNLAPGPGGGFYGDIGLGLGGGFNLHLDREGVTPSAGGGVFGTAKIGYAPSAAALAAVRGEKGDGRAFLGLRGLADLSLEHSRAGLAAQAVGGPFVARVDNIGTADVDPHIGVQIPLGPRRRPAAPTLDERRPTASAQPAGTFEIGFDGGGGYLRNLGRRP
jgi:hypothetical protein